MSEGSDKNGYLFPYTAEEDHSSLTGIRSNDMNNPGVLPSSRMSSRQGSRGPSPPSISNLPHQLEPLTSITDKSE